jgi:uncharacterized protein (TIGR03086 family)
MNEAEVFVLADATLNRVIAQIRDEQWDMEMPASFVMRNRDRSPSLREIVNYHAYDDSWVPDTLSGKTMEEVGRDKFDGDLLGNDPQASFAAIVEQACAAARRFDDFDRIVHLSFGDYTAREYLWQVNSFRTLRAHDIAQVIGADTKLPDDLVQGFWEELEPHAEEWRSLGVFGPAVPVPAGASLQDRMLGLTGRQPDGR